MKNTFFAVAVLVVLFLMLLLPGCTQQGGNETYSFNNAFTARENVTYVSSKGGVHLRATNFTDSRCPTGVQCIWAGERGLDATLYLDGDPALLLGTLHLGETTAKIADTNLGTNRLNYEVELVSVDTDTNSAVLIVKEKQNSPQEGREWFSIEPKQCNSNAWDIWETKKMKDIVASGGLPERPLNEADVVRDWLYGSYGIRVYNVASKQVAEITCEACSCSTGERIAVFVDSSNSAKMLELGFTQMEPVACIMDAKACPNGSAVGRTAPFCEFEACSRQQ